MTLLRIKCRVTGHTLNLTEHEIEDMKRDVCLHPPPSGTTVCGTIISWYSLTRATRTCLTIMLPVHATYIQTYRQTYLETELRNCYSDVQEGLAWRRMCRLDARVSLVFARRTLHRQQGIYRYMWVADVGGRLLERDYHHVVIRSVGWTPMHDSWETKRGILQLNLEPFSAIYSTCLQCNSIQYPFR